MLTEPKLIERAEQPYVAYVLTVAQPEISQVAPPLIGKVIDWLKTQGATSSGAPFFNYFGFLPDGRMQMQVGMPTASQLAASGEVATGVLPGGRYASVTHTGPYHELLEANMALDKWGRDQELAFAGEERDGGMYDATRLEIYHKDPGEDPSGFPVTEVAFRLKD